MRHATIHNTVFNGTINEYFVITCVDNPNYKGPRTQTTKYKTVRESFNSIESIYHYLLKNKVETTCWLLLDKLLNHNYNVNRRHEKKYEKLLKNLNVS